MKALILLLVFAAMPVLARINETPEECAQRYGAPIHVNTAENCHEFLKNGIKIKAWFFGGYCDCITYSKLDGRFSDEEYLMLRQISTPENSSWVRSNRFFYDWQLSDGWLLMNRTTFGGNVEVVTREHLIREAEKLERERAQKAEDDRKKLKGF